MPTKPLRKIINSDLASSTVLLRNSRLRPLIFCFITGLVLFLGSCSGSNNPATSQPMNEPPADGMLDPFEQNARLGRGVNLANALEAPNEGEWGVVIRDWFFDRIKGAGFDAVRIPVRWSSHAATGAPFSIEEPFLERVTEVIDQARSRGLMAVVNMHHYEEIMQNPAGHKERFVGMWRNIAEKLKGYPADVIFELLNEPNSNLTPALWNQYLREALEVIRETNPGRTLVVGCANWYDLQALHLLELPPDDRNLIVSFHYYNPFQFTHQGASWVPGSEPWLGATWNGTTSQRAAIVTDLTVASDWSNTHNRPVLLGEFGAIDKADMASRARWTAFVARTAESLGISWSYWDFSANFAVYDASAMDWHYPILHALIPPTFLTEVWSEPK